MTRCYRMGKCRGCKRRDRCTPEARRFHVRWVSRQTMVCASTIRKAAEILSTGWLTALELGCQLYGKDPKTPLERKSVSVRARRSINRLLALGLVAVRPPQECNKGAAFTLVPGGLEELAC